VSPNVLSVLVKEYGVRPVDLEDHDRDLNAMLSLVRPEMRTQTQNKA
jgi:hypothetical protein